MYGSCEPDAPGFSLRLCLPLRVTERGIADGIIRTGNTQRIKYASHVSGMRGKNPTWSRLSVVFSMPVRGIVPKEGLQPYTLQNDAGRTIEPAVCVPVATGTIPRETATATRLKTYRVYAPHRTDSASHSVHERRIPRSPFFPQHWHLAV